MNRRFATTLQASQRRILFTQPQFYRVIAPFIVAFAVFLNRTVVFMRTFVTYVFEEYRIAFWGLVIEAAFDRTFSGRATFDPVEFIQFAFLQAELIFFLAGGRRYLFDVMFRAVAYIGIGTISGIGQQGFWF